MVVRRTSFDGYFSCRREKSLGDGAILCRLGTHGLPRPNNKVPVISKLTGASLPSTFYSPLPTPYTPTTATHSKPPAPCYPRVQSHRAAGRDVRRRRSPRAGR